MNQFALFFFAFFAIEGVDMRNLPGQCPTITLFHGRVRYRQKGRIARFMCNPGFMLAGDKYSMCIGGKWDNLVSKCVRASCKTANPPSNGFIYPSYGGAVLHFYCKSGYEIRGANITFCDGLKWENPLPACLPTNSSPPTSCAFESPDLCGWNHDLNHNFDWQRLNFATPSGTIGTGPNHDHTKGPGKDGYYMYIESSARNVGDTARLISPVYDKANETVCFEFFYHMYGATTGSLRVYLKKVGQKWTSPIFEKSGNQGNKWFRGFVVIGAVDEDFQIVIEGVRGSSYVSDIAIDDVRVIMNCVPQNEVVEEETTTEEWMSSTGLISVETCENRCNSTDNQTMQLLITCDCDDDCYAHNRCCPDYFDFCVASSNTDFYDETTETTPSIFTTVKSYSDEVTKKPTFRPKTFAPKVQTTAKLPTIIPPITITPMQKTTSISTLPPTARTTKLVETPSDVVDIIVTNKEEIETPAPPPKEVEAITVSNSDKSFHQKIEVASSTSESNTKTVVFAVGVVFGVLFAMVITTFVARRYQLCQCKKMRQSSSGDSQSDVRFLTSDEILDFSLAGDYDSL